MPARIRGPGRPGIGRDRTGSAVVTALLFALLLPATLAAQDPGQVALLRGQVGVDPEPGSLLATPARLTVSGLPLADALSRLAERSHIRIAFSPTLLPEGHRVECDCTGLNTAGALDRLLAGTGLGYVELGSQVVVVPLAKPEIPGADGRIRGPAGALATLAGIVRDSTSLEPVAFARVTVTPAGGEAVAGTSDRYGAFVVPGIAAAGPVLVEVRTFGHAWARTYDVPPSDPIRALLGPAPIGLEGIDVVGGGGDPVSSSRDAFIIDSVLLRSLPAMPETDVLRATAVSPSASAASDYASVPLIRGGAGYGTPVLLDGVRLFNPFHLGGLVSAISPEVVERSILLAGSGGDGLAIGSLSGAIDIATRDGSRDRRRTAGSLSLFSSRFSVEGPIGERMSHVVGGRRTWMDGGTLVLKKLGVVKTRFPYSFQDVHGKLTADLGGVRRLSVSGYFGTESNRSARNVWGSEIRHRAYTLHNAAFSAHYRDRLGRNGIVDAYLGQSRFASDLLYQESSVVGGTTYPPDRKLIGDGAMSETRTDLRATWHAGRTTILAGAQAAWFKGEHQYTFLRSVDGGDAGRITSILSPLALRENHGRLAAYSSVQVLLRSGFSTRAGLRADRFRGLATTLAPFAELSYAASWWGARISGSRSYQALVSLRNEEVPEASVVAYDLLVPVRQAPVPRNTEFSIGWEGRPGGLLVRLDAYTRTLDHIRLPHPGANAGTGPVLRDPSLWAMAKGTARGIEVSWRWMRDRGFSVLGSYRWARVSRTVGSRTYTPRFHRDHEFDLGSTYRHGASSWSARVSLRSGQPATPWVASIPSWEGWPGPERVLLGGEYNSVKLPHYTRIDVGWRRESEVSWFGGGSLVPYVSVANLFNRFNVVSREPYGHTLAYTQQFPIVPSIGAEFRF